MPVHVLPCGTRPCQPVVSRPRHARGLSWLSVTGLLDLINPQHLIQTFGTIGLFAIIFAESGLLLGLIFPRLSLLFTAGLLAAGDRFGLRIWVIAPTVFVAAVLGAEAGYWIGHRFGPGLFRRPDSRIFKHEYVERSEHFFEHHGSKAIVLA